MNQFEVFDFNEQPVRVRADEAGALWWVATDVCRVLEIQNTPQALQSLDEDERATISNTYSRPGAGAQTLGVINEPGLYSLVLRSRKPQAKAFKRWITHEVLPSIRRTGAYACAVGLPAAAVHVSPEAPALADVPYCTVREFAREHCRDWRQAKVDKLATGCHRTARAQRLEVRDGFDGSYGKAPSYPKALCFDIKRDAEANRLEVLRSDMEEFHRMLAALPRQRWMKFDEVAGAARRSGCFAEMLGCGDEMSPKQRSEFGQLLARWIDLPRVISATESLVLRRKGQMRHRSYQVEVQS